MYRKRTPAVEAYQWFGEEVFTPSAGFEPCIVRRPGGLFLGSLASDLLRHGNFILKYANGNYRTMSESEFIANHDPILND
jgi:hypothetical protein